MRGRVFTPDFPLPCTGSLGSVRSVNAIRALRLRAARLPLPGADGALPLEARLHRQCHACRGFRPGSPAPGRLRERRAHRSLGRADGSLSRSLHRCGRRDLATPKALATAHEVASASNLTDARRRALLVDFDWVRDCRSTLPCPPRLHCRTEPPNSSSGGQRPVRRATSSHPTRCATSWPHWASKSVTPPVARRQGSANQVSPQEFPSGRVPRRPRSALGSRC